MSYKCPNCATVLISDEVNPHVREVLVDFYSEEYWLNDTKDIGQELCSSCGTLPELIPFIEEQIAKDSQEAQMKILKEFEDNNHIPFLLQVGAPFFVLFATEEEEPKLQQRAVDLLGTFGAIDDLGRYVLAHQDPEVRVMGLRALERIAKHYRKRKKTLDWGEYLEYMVGEELETAKLALEKMSEEGFLKSTTVEEIKPLIEEWVVKLSPPEEDETEHV